MGMPNRREFVALSVGTAAASRVSALSAPVAAAAPPGDLVAMSLAEASRQIRARQVTAVELTQALLDRIKVYNPKLNAYITVMRAEALGQAARLDEEAKQGKFRSPLHGVPIALKDNVDTAGTRTTAASQVFDDRVPDEDADVARRLKEAGAVIIGKTNLHEFANGGSSASTYFGPVRNPWALDRIPSGSSGGSAAAVSADLAFGALGTDTGGSIRQPAAFCSIVGLKPTYGLVSIRGIIPLIYSLDHCGPMTKTVEDAAILLNHMTGYDSHDVASVEHAREDYVAALKQPVAGLRLGVPRAPYFDRLDDEIAAAVESALAVLSGLTKSTVDCRLPSTAGFDALSIGAERVAYHLELFRRNSGRYSLHIRQSLEATIKSMNDGVAQPCARRLEGVLPRVGVDTEVLGDSLAERRHFDEPTHCEVEVTTTGPSNGTAFFFGRPRYSERRPSEGRRRAAYSAGKIVATRQMTMATAPVMRNSVGRMFTGSFEMK